MIRLLVSTGVEVRATEARVNRFHEIGDRTGELQKFVTEVGVDRRPVLGCDRFQREDDVLGKPEGDAAEREQRQRRIQPARIPSLRP